MISLKFLNFLFPQLTNVLVFMVSLIFATAAGVTAFLLLSSGSIKNFKKNVLSKNRTSQLPIVTPDGNVVDSKEELEAHLEVLENRLLEKVGEIASSKTKINDAKESIDKLNTTQSQVKKYYIKLKDEIKKSEDDCKRLQHQIDDYRERRAELEKEMKKNEVCYKHLLGAVKSNDSLNTSLTSSKSSLSSGDSSASSYYDSSQQVTEGESVNQDNAKLKSKYRKIKGKPTTATEPGSKTAISNETSHSDNISKPSLPLIPTESNENLKKKISGSSLVDSSKEVSRDNSKTNLKSASMGCNRSSSATSQKTRISRGKLAGKTCSCGSDKCAGSCTAVRFTKFGFAKPRTPNGDIMENVELKVGKMSIGVKESPLKRTKMEESCIRKSPISRLANKF